MNIRELARLTGQPERQIRYMIAEGFVPPPEGGRAHADYGEAHVTAIRRYSALRSRGFAPQAIRALLASNETVPFPVAPGMTLHVEPELLGVPMDADALVDRIRQSIEEFFKEQSDDRSHAPRQRSR